MIARPYVFLLSTQAAVLAAMTTRSKLAAAEERHPFYLVGARIDVESRSVRLLIDIYVYEPKKKLYFGDPDTKSKNFLRSNCPPSKNKTRMLLPTPCLPRC